MIYLAAFAIKYTRVHITPTVELEAASPYEACDLTLKLFPEVKDWLDTGEIYLDYTPVPQE